MITYFVFQDKTVFMPLKFLYPECAYLIKDNPQLHQLFCLKHDICPVNRNCMDNLAKRVFYVFDKIEPQAELLVAYFKVGESIKAGLFTKDMDDPKLITCNRSAFTKFQNESVVYNWEPTLEFSLSSGAVPLISVPSLIR